MRFEVLPGLPAYGPMALSFTRHGAREYREGLVVRFHPSSSEPWVGNFIGGGTACNFVLDHPNGTDVIVVAQGEAYIVNPENRTIRETIAGDVEEIFPLPSLRSIVFRCMVDFHAVTAADTGWRSPRISWDGLRNIEVRGTELVGEAYTPVEDTWVPFTLDLRTGQCPDGIYEKEIARAVLIGPARGPDWQSAIRHLRNESTADLHEQRWLSLRSTHPTPRRAQGRRGEVIAHVWTGLADLSKQKPHTVIIPPH